MLSFKSALAALAVLFAAPVVAFAQSAVPPIANAPVLVFNSERIIGESTVGRDAQTKLTALRNQMAAEAAPEETAIRTEQEALRPLVQGQTQEQIAANPTLRPRFEALQRRLGALQQANLIRAQDLEYTQIMTLRELERLIGPVVDEVRQQRNGQVVLDSSSVSRFVGGVDITADVLSRLNQRVQTINVTRQSAPRQQPQGQPAPAQPQR